MQMAGSLIMRQAIVGCFVLGDKRRFPPGWLTCAESLACIDCSHAKSSLPPVHEVWGRQLGSGPFSQHANGAVAETEDLASYQSNFIE